jgi:hypothetical protein
MPQKITDLQAVARPAVNHGAMIGAFLSGDAIAASLTGGRSLAHQPQRFVLDFFPVKDASLGQAQHELRQLVARGIYRFGPRADLRRDLLPRILERLSHGFHLGGIERGACEELAGFHGEAGSLLRGTS